MSLKEFGGSRQIPPSVEKFSTPPQVDTFNHDLLSSRIPRRRFIQGMLTLAGAAALAACGTNSEAAPQTPPAQGGGISAAGGEITPVATNTPAGLPIRIPTLEATATSFTTPTTRPEAPRPEGTPSIAGTPGTPRPEGTPSIAGTPRPEGTPVPERLKRADDGLAAAAEKRGITLGGFTNGSSIQLNPEFFAAQYKEVTIDGSLDPKVVQYKKGLWGFETGDKIAKFTAERMPEDATLQVHHAMFDLVDRLPDWMMKLQGEELLGEVVNHVTEVAKHYPQARVLSVVNETVMRTHTNKGYITKTLGNYKWVDQCFQAAREANPNAQLIWNEYANHYSNAWTDALYTEVSRMKKAGVPIDGVGFQMHIDASKAPTKADMVATFKRFAKLGIKLYVTELDVSIKNLTGTKEAKYDKQAQVYRDCFEAAIDAGITDISIFGLTDDILSGENMLFDAAKTPKPAYFAVMDTLQNYGVANNSNTLFSKFRNLFKTA